MDEQQKSSVPFLRLGARLKGLREQHSESVAEVSGAVEIDEKDLASIESGRERPSEDILMLLISHFGIAEEHAAELWQLAGYGARSLDTDFESDQPAGSTHSSRTQTMMIMLDPRVMYSDSVEVVSNSKGIIINFAQTAGPEASPLVVARVGMSLSQAKAVMGILHQVLYNTENPGNTRRLGAGH